MHGRVCVAGPSDPAAPRGLGFDFAPIIDAAAAAGTKYLDYKSAKDQARLQEQQMRLQELEAQRRMIATGTGAIGGGTLALLAAAAFFLMARRR